MSENSQIVFKRSQHNKEKPYAVISRELIQNQKLSPNCRWMLIYLLSMRDDFKINIKQVWHHVQEFLGRDQVYKMIEEAIENGYMMREDVYKGNLKAGCIYYIEEAPEFKKCFRLPEPQYTEARYTEGQEALISTSSNKYDKNISPIVPKGDPPVFSKSRKVKEEKVEVAPNVFLTETQRLNLLERLKNNSEKLSACYDKLSVWKVGKGTTNINDYLNILRWVIKAVEEEASKPKPLDQEALNRDLASKVSEKYEYHKDIVFGYDYIEFKFGYNNFPHIKFRDFGFREQVINNLHKLGLRTEGL